MKFLDQLRVASPCVGQPVPRQLPEHGYVSLASIVAAAAFPLAVRLLDPPEQPEILWLDVAVAAGIIWLHRANIGRLLRGTEHRFGRRAAPHPRP